MKEKAFLAELLPRLAQGRDVRVGPGDDCALVDFGGECLLLAVDQVIAGVHFDADAPPTMVGRKLLCRNLSDIAAMGGEPRHALVAVAAGFADAIWLRQFMAGIAAAAAEWSTSVVGGDLATLPGNGFVAALTITGRIAPDRVCRRSGAAVGDRLLATGCFGNAVASGHHLAFTPRMREGAFLADGWARAMIDVSDGLLLDAATMARASGLALALDPERVPRREGADLAAALGDGEDYELLFAVAAERVPALLAAWPFPATPCTDIGEFTAGPPGEIRSPAGSGVSACFCAGWDHAIGKGPA
jgi:thiamine-monophosphate kinase